MSCCCQTSPVPSSCRVTITSADIAELLYVQGLDADLCVKFQLLSEAVQLVDCAGNVISIDTPIVTCADFRNQLCAALLTLDEGGDVEFGVTQLVGNDCQTYVVQETPLVVVDSDCIDLTASGDFGHTLTADIIISPDAGNTVECRANGLFAGDSTVVVGGDTDCIEVTVVEGPADTFTVTADPVISPNTGNQIDCIGNGLFVPKAAGLEVLDTATVDLTLSAGVLHADAIVSPNAGNIITIQPNGLYAAGADDVIINAVDTACLNLDVSEGPASTFTITGNIIIDPDADNLLSCNGDGLFSEPPSCDQIVEAFSPAINPAPPEMRFLAEDCSMYTIPQAEAPDCETIIAQFTPAGAALAANGLILGADCKIYEAPGVVVTDTACINMSVVKGAGHNYSISAVPTLANTYPGYDADCNSLQCTVLGLTAPPDVAGDVDTVLSSVNIHPSGPSMQGDIYTSETLHLDIVNPSDCRSAVLTTVYRHPACRLDYNTTTGGCAPYRCNIISYRDTNLPGVEVITAPVTESHLFSDSVFEGFGIQHSETVLVYIVPPSFTGSIELSVVADVSVGCADSLFISNIRLSYTLVTIGA